MKDYYAILHVLPSAEIDVIKAAYKALARKYHPDAFEGDKTYASKRMQEINDAFGVIGDPDKRKKYDAERKAANQEDEFTSNGEENDARLEEDWKVACKYCPEAAGCFIHLNKLSRSLAFAFKSYLLDSKQFSACKTIRDKFRAEFLNNYFGTNPAIQDIGELLVVNGELQAAKSVNRAVKVMRTALDVNKLIERLEADYPLLKERMRLKARLLIRAIIRRPDDWFLCRELFKVMDIPYSVSFWGTYTICYQGKSVRVNDGLLGKWVAANFRNKLYL